jgi:RNA 2',3'-cyclic 3'-phosphodiesterase
MIRLFAALPVPPDIAEGLQRRQQGLPGARWSPLDNLHITLRFFGEVSEPVAAELDDGLAALGADGFELALEGVGSFGEREQVRAVWAGVADSEPLRRLAARCETVAKRCGLKAETRSYRPHVTLAYLRHTPEARAAAWVQGHNMLRSPPWRAWSFGLYSSWRSQDGSRYELEREYPLG